MTFRPRFRCVLIALGLGIGTLPPSAAQNHDGHQPPKHQRQAASRGRQQLEGAHKPQSGRPKKPNGDNRPPQVRSDLDQEPNFNSNGPPIAINLPRNPKRFQDLSPEEKRRVLQNEEKFSRLPPQKQQELRESARNWARLTAAQQNHIKNDLLPMWKQLSPERRDAIKSRLGVLWNMPESARNRDLNDPNFTLGMSEEDKAMLRDLSYIQVSAPIFQTSK